MIINVRTVVEVSEPTETNMTQVTSAPCAKAIIEHGTLLLAGGEGMDFEPVTSVEG